ncbi:hypothetical protein ABPG74_005444 [Tetrahymena malaccensis]
MKQEDIHQSINDSKEEHGFQLDTKIQTFKYMPYSQKNKNMPAKIIYQKEPDRFKHQSQEDLFDISSEQKGKQKQSFDSPSKMIGQQFFKNQHDESSGNQMKDFRQKAQSIQNPYKISQNYSTGDFNQSKNISQIVEEQMSNLQNTYTTQIIKKSANIDFDLSRSLKNNLIYNKDQNAHNFSKRKSVVEFKSPAQQNFDNLVSPSTNKSNQYSFFKAGEPGQTIKSPQMRHQSLDSKPRYQNNIQLPSLVNNNSNSPSATQKGHQNQNQNNFDKLSNSVQNSNKSIYNRNHRSSFLSYFSNQGETANSTPTNNTNKQSLQVKDAIQQQLEQKQSLLLNINNHNENRASPNNSKFQSIFSQNQQKQETYNAIFNKYEKSFQQGDEYLSNRRKSNLQSSKVSLSNPGTPQNSKQNFNKQNQNSQFYRMNFQQQYGTPKMNNIQRLEMDQDKFTFDCFQIQTDQKNQSNTQYHFQQQSNSNNINQQQDSQNIKNDQNSSDHSLNNEKQTQINYGNANKQLPSLINIANLSESTNLPYNSGNVENLQLKIANNEYFNEIKSPGQQSITLTSINFKDFEQIKAQCLKTIQDQFFTEDFHKNSFENAADIPHNQQIETILKFVSLCLEELQQDFFQLQIDNSNPSFVNFKEIDAPNQFSFNQLSISSMNHCVNWPKLSFQYPQKFCQTFVERVTSLLEQNEILKKKIFYIKRLVSYNFRKYFCYRDFINEIKGTQNLTHIIDKVVKNIQKFYNNQQIFDYFSDIKSFCYSLLEGDQIGIDKIINKHIVFPSFVNLSSSQQENQHDASAEQEGRKNVMQQSQNKNNLEQDHVANKQNVQVSQSKLYQLTGIKMKKNNQTNNKDKTQSGQWKFNPINFFDIKINIFNTLIEEEFISSHSIMKILEQIEGLRYGNFRCFFGNDIALSYQEHVKNILTLIPENHLNQLLNQSSLGNIKKDFQLFFNQFCELIFVENSSTQQLKNLCISQNINLNYDTFFLLENQVNYIINAMKIIPLCQRKDIKFKLQKLKRLLNLSESFDSVYDNLNEIVNELQVYSDKQFTQNKQYTDEQIKSIKVSFKYFQYLLHTVLCTEGAFSNYDMGFAFQEHSVKEDSLNLWIKYLKRILQKYNIKNQIISSIEQILTEIIQNKVFI